MTFTKGNTANSRRIAKRPPAAPPMPKSVGPAPKDTTGKRDKVIKSE